MPKHLVLPIAGAGSALALWQATHVISLVHAAADQAGRAGAIHLPLVIVETTADKRLDIPIWQMGGKGVFVKEVQAAVLDGRARIAVHSGKDLPSTAHPDLVIAAVPERGDPRDALIGSMLDGLSPGAVATGSVRRRAQLAWLRPDLTFDGLRGNIATRLEKIPDGGAIVMAAAALDRLGLHDEIDAAIEVLEPNVMLPQVAQGALAVECRADDDEAGELLAMIQHELSRITFDAERAFLEELGGDCDLPAGAHAIANSDGTLTIDALLASLDGHALVRAQKTCAATDSVETGRALARHLLDDCGGSALLDR